MLALGVSSLLPLPPMTLFPSQKPAQDVQLFFPCPFLGMERSLSALYGGAPAQVLEGSECPDVTTALHYLDDP